MKSKRLLGFTLAEVLITLGVIGVVAAITIPILLQNMQDQALREALKKDVAIISQATINMAQDNGGTLKGLFSNTSHNAAPFLPYLIYTKYCDFNIGTGGCWSLNWYDYNGNAPNFPGGVAFYSGNTGFALNDGTFVIMGAGATPACTGGWMGWENSGYWSAPACLAIWVDVNGFKPPNRLGKDIFDMYLNEPGIVSTKFTGGQTNNVGIGCTWKAINGQSCP